MRIGSLVCGAADNFLFGVITARGDIQEVNAVLGEDECKADGVL